MLVDALIAILILMLVGALPTWPYSRNWGYYGASGVGSLLLVVGLLVFFNVV